MIDRQQSFAQNRMKRITLVLAVVTVLQACATTEKFTNKMNGFIGASELDLIGTYGAPNYAYTLGDGSKVLTYTRGGNVQFGGHTINQLVTTTSTASVYGARVGAVSAVGTSTTYVPVQQPTHNVTVSCTVNFTLSPNGTVMRWAASGNRCVAD